MNLTFVSLVSFVVTSTADTKICKPLSQSSVGSPRLRLTIDD
jgi:hypothetical protein